MLKFSKNVPRHIALLLLFSTIVASDVHAKIYIFTLLEKTRGAEIILLARCIKIQDQKYELEFPKIPGKEFKADRFAVYKIMEVWKGKYDKDTIILDYKLTNEKYKPFICSPAVHSAIDEQVILFIEKDFAIFAGFQGKIRIDEEKVPLYQDAIMKFLELDTLGEREKVLATIKMVEDNNAYVRESILRELREIDNTTYGIQIASLLEHKDVLVRQRAISALVRTKDKRVVPLVIKALKDSDSRVRADAATVLWRIDDERITPALMAAFNDVSPQVRSRVISALSRRGSKEAIPLYFKALKDEDTLVRAYGANAFEGIPDSRAISELLNALKDENARVRQAAVSSLISYASPEIVEPVSTLLTDENWSVREYAASCIKRIAWRGYRDSLKTDKIINNLLQMAETEERSNVRSSAIYALGAIGSERAIPILIKLLSGTQIETRASAATALSNIGNIEVLPHLLKALENEDNEYVKGQLKTAIKQLREVEEK